MNDSFNKRDVLLGFALLDFNLMFNKMVYGINFKGMLVAVAF